MVDGFGFRGIGLMKVMEVGIRLLCWSEKGVVWIGLGREGEDDSR